MMLPPLSLLRSSRQTVNDKRIQLKRDFSQKKTLAFDKWAPRGFGDPGRMAVYFQGAGELW